MRSFILLIVIAILILIGQSVPITNQGQPTVKKMLSMTNAEKFSSFFKGMSKAAANGGKAM